MFKFIVLLSAFVVVTHAIIEQGNLLGISMEFLTPAEMDDFLKKHPNAQQFSVEHSKSFNYTDAMGETREILGLSLGLRIPGDRVVSAQQAITSWTTPKSVNLNFVYPKPGTMPIPAVVTHVSMGVQRSNYLGRAYVTAGGIGQNFISFVLESINTYSLNYILDIYGI